MEPNYIHKEKGVKATVTEVTEPTKFDTKWGEVSLAPGAFVVETQDDNGNPVKFGISADDLERQYEKI